MTTAPIIVHSFQNFPAPLSIGNCADYLTQPDLDDHYIHRGLDEADPNHAKSARCALDGLRQVYPTKMPPTLRTGDPRAFLSETNTRVAYLKSQIGIHCEVFLKNERAFHENKQQWLQRLTMVAGIFDRSILFVSSVGILNEDTDTVTINAFTPLSNGSVAGHKIAPKSRHLMLSPYLNEAVEPNLEHCPTMSALHNSLQLIAEGWAPIDAVTHAKEQARTRNPLPGTPLLAAPTA